MRITSNRRERGDTMVEVVIAMAVLGLILASIVAIINKSLLGVMAAVERTSARAQFNSQIEMLRYVFDTQSSTNKQLAADIAAYTKSDKAVPNMGCQVGGSGFYLRMNNNSATAPVQMVKIAATPSRVTNAAADLFGAPTPNNNNGQTTGIWIEGVKYDTNSANVPGYIDFYVRACWTPFGAQEVGQGRILSTVRVQYFGGK